MNKLEKCKVEEALLKQMMNSYEDFGGSNQSFFYAYCSGWLEELQKDIKTLSRAEKNKTTKGSLKINSTKKI